MLDFSLILPVLNEEDIIIPVVRDIEKHLNTLRINYEIVLVENESTDGTLAVIQNLAKKDPHVRVVKTARGYGSAVIAGIKHAKGKFVGYMPSDGQIDAKLLIQLWRIMNSEQYDVVKICRVTRESAIRFLRSKVFNLLTRMLYPIDVTDINGSPRIVAATKLRQLDLQYPDSFIDVEFTVKAHYLRWTWKEIPMPNINRLGGSSTVRFATVLEFLRNLSQFRSNPSFLQWQKKYLK